MITSASGLFGSKQPANDTIDNAAEVSAAVDAIIEDAVATNDDTAADPATAALMLAQHYAFMERRVKMLTWAVVALAAVVLLKEL